MEHPEMKKRRGERRHRLTKGVRALLWTAAAVAVATALLLLLPTIRSRFPSKYLPQINAEQPYKTLETLDPTTLSAIEVTHSDGERYTLEYSEGALLVRQGDGEPTPINEAYTDAILSAATDLTVEGTVAEKASEVADNLADMGLESPAITVAVTFTTGRVVTLRFGERVPETTYYYYTWSGDDGVYMCSNGVYEAFEYTARMLLPVEQPLLAEPLIEGLRIEKPNGATLAMRFTGNSSGAYSGALTSPCSYPMNAESVTNLLTDVTNLRLGTRLEAVSAANSAVYGFDTPTAIIDVQRAEGAYNDVDENGALQVRTLERATLRFVIGAKDGEYFYFCRYAGDCYRVSSFLLAGLLETTAADVVSRAPADFGDEELSAVTAQTGEGAFDMRVVRTERVESDNHIATDDDGNVLYDVSVTVNGEPVSEDAYATLVARLKQMTVSGSAPEGAVATGTPRWTLALTTVTGQTRTLTAYPNDAFSDLLAVDGVILHYVNDEALAIVLQGLQSEG